MSGQVYQFKITLRDVEPAIWRQIQVPEYYTFWDLHVAIQDAMGWTDSHLHLFTVGPAFTPGSTGIGIPKSELRRVFDRFYQVDSSSTRHYRGTGLGLTISKHIIEYHQGRIWAESEEGEGSTFFFLLPKHIGAEADELLLDFMTLPDRDH